MNDVAKVGMARGKDDRQVVWMRDRPFDEVISDSDKYCPLCGKEMTPVTVDLTPSTYHLTRAPSQEKLNPEHSEVTVKTRYYCSDCDYYSDQKPTVVKLK